MPPCDLYVLFPRDLNVHRSPLLLGDVPDELRADDGVQQHIVLDALRDAAGDIDVNGPRYEDLPVEQVPLSKLQDIMENGRTNNALKLLQQRTEIVIDEGFKYSAHSSELAYSLAQHHLDFLMVLSDGIGFDACLPNARNDLTFVFHLDLHQPHRALPMKHVDLGFPVRRNALYIGRSRGKDMVYLLMAPNTFISQDEVDPDDIIDPSPPASKLPTNMTGKHYFMLVMFMAMIFQKHFPDLDVYCHEPYPNIDENAWRNVRNTTNIL